MRIVLVALVALTATAGCDDQSPDAPRYFERVIQPILTTNCVRNQGGCHRDDGTSNALGNLDLTSYASVTRRRDVLRTFGSYPVPLLLLKGAGTAVPPIPYSGAAGGMTQLFPSQIQHAGGSTLNVQSGAYFELQRWMANGASEDGSPAQKPRQSGAGACRKDFAVVRPDMAARVATVDASDPTFTNFAANVEPVLTTNCAIGTCHSSEQSDFFLTCSGNGSDDASKFNYLEAREYVVAASDTSPLLLKPLAPSAGGLVHTGGVFFKSKDDSDWKHLSAWAALVGAADDTTMLSDGQQFFNDQVMPVLLQRGCALEACHSPGSANDFKLRAGASGGFFSGYSLAFNYKEARESFLVADVPDVRQTRLVKKPIVSTLEGGLGLVHRGGPPLQSPGEMIDPTACPQPWPSDGSSTPFCTLVEWHRRERAALLAAGQADAMAAGSTLPLVAVVRPPDADRLIDFDTYRPGADVVLARVTLGALGAIDPASATVTGSLLDNCAGVHANRDNVDARRPAVRYDASRIAVALRLSAVDSLDLYEITLDAAHTCTKITDGNGQAPGGIKVHNLDPMYAPDGTLVFASTRGRAGVGPTRSLKYLLPQTDLWRMAPAGSGYGAPEQMTALLGDELSPAMMLNGQVTFTAEKASADFYQLSGRRINWDLTDYHPLLAQRSQSPGLDGNFHPSVDYRQATEIREGLDRNFVIILSDVGTRGAGGALATFNRSVGPFEADRSDVTFLRSLTIVDGSATGRAGATLGAYRAPFPLPDGRILVSYAPDVHDLSADTPRYDLAVIDPASGARVAVGGGLSGGASSHLDAVLVYKREPRPLFHNLTQLVFGGTVDPNDTGHGTVHYPDLPMLATLLGANLRTGRFVDNFRGAQQVVLYEDQAPPSDVAAAMAGLTGMEMVYQSRKRLGSADLASDGSVQLRLPPLTPLVLQLVDSSGTSLFQMSEEDQLGPGEHISRGVPERFFNSTCAGCHGSVSGRELDIAIDPDALTGASVSLSRDPANAQSLGP